ncbi:MAG: hypothetical protein WKF51_10600 [Geodermatophilaceae bacterium]
MQPCTHDLDAVRKERIFQPPSPGPATQTQRAVAFSEYGDPSVLRLMNLPEPHARAGQVRVRMRAVKLVERMLGHASAAMTLDVYAALFDDDLGALAESMDAASAAHSAYVRKAAVGTVWARDASTDT